MCLLPHIASVAEDQARRIGLPVVVLDVGKSAPKDQLVPVGQPPRVLRRVDSDERRDWRELDGPAARRPGGGGGVLCVGRWRGGGERHRGDRGASEESDRASLRPSSFKADARATERQLWPRRPAIRPVRNELFEDRRARAGFSAGQRRPYFFSVSVNLISPVSTWPSSPAARHETTYAPGFSGFATSAYIDLLGLSTTVFPTGNSDLSAASSFS